MAARVILLGAFLYSSTVMAFDQTHAKWNEFIKAHVVVVNDNASQVRYAKAKKDPALLDAYLKEVSAVSRKDYDGWTDAQKQALLINAYNAFTIKLILDNDIPKSIKDTGSFLRSPWKKKFFTFLGEESHLDRLEHELARGKYTNCRFHFAFNCASVGCPMLREEAFVADKLTEQLEDSTRRFLMDRSRNRYEAKDKTLYVSKIFDWYEDDFEKDKNCGGSIRAFASRYIKTAEGKPLPEGTKVKFLDYDWSLNAAK